jgi:hypothetical protein
MESKGLLLKNELKEERSRRVKVIMDQELLQKEEWLKIPLLQKFLELV